MREIKFRGKRVATGKWVYGGIAEYDDHMFIMDNGNSIVVKPDTIGQYTGLKDRNGKEIYEGDILDSEYFQNPKFHPLGLCELRWVADGWDCRTPWDDSCTLYTAVVSYGAVVIGNIHDNPVLMKGGAE